MSGTERKQISKAGDVRRVEFFGGGGQRRQWRPEVKARILAESCDPGVRVSDVARRHGVCAQQLFRWRREAQRGPATAMEFVPVVVASGNPRRRPEGERPAGIVVEIGDGRVHVPDAVDAATLRTVLLALR